MGRLESRIFFLLISSDSQSYSALMLKAAVMPILSDNLLLIKKSPFHYS